MSEKRFMNIPGRLELREAEDGSPSEFHGVIPYDSKSNDLGYFVETIKPGAFRKTLQEADVRAVWYHSDPYVLGRSKSGTLRFEDRDDGLHFFCKIADRSYARDLVDLIKTGDVDGVSFRFRTIKDSWDYDQDPALRELIEVQLIEVSLGVTWQAYPGASSDVRSMETPIGFSLAPLAGILMKAKNPNAGGTMKENERSALDEVEAEIRKARAYLEGTEENDQEEEERGAEPDHSAPVEDEPDPSTHYYDELRALELEILEEF